MTLFSPAFSEQCMIHVHLPHSKWNSADSSIGPYQTLSSAVGTPHLCYLHVTLVPQYKAVRSQQCNIHCELSGEYADL
jgi:hypothetical protein